MGRTYSTPLCFQDAADKELFDPLPDIKVKVQSSFMVSLSVAERAEFHAKTAAETFPRDPSRDYCVTADRRVNGLLTLNGPFSTAEKEPLMTAAVFGHEGGRLVAPNTGEFPNGPRVQLQTQASCCYCGLFRRKSRWSRIRGNWAETKWTSAVVAAGDKCCKDESADK